VALEGIRVLELGELVAGPFIGTLLGEFGAEVIKIERPGRGDVLRQFGPIADGESLYWAVNARNKKSVVLDLIRPEARNVLRDLIVASDVLVNSLRPGTLESWGLPESALREVAPRLVVVNASAFGRTGPYSDRGGYDPIAQGYSGLSYLTGDANGPPMRAGGAIPVCDFTTGFAGALGALLALYDRDAGGRTGRGGSVDIALYDVAFRMLGPLLAYYDLTGKVWQRDGNHSLGGAPTGHFLASDGRWICTSVQNNEQFARLARMIGRPDWLDDPRFCSLPLRTRHREAIEADVTAWIACRHSEEILRLFSQADLPVGPINSMADLAEDTHLQTRSVFWTGEESRRHRHPTRVPKLVDAPEPEHRKAPRLGEHTSEVMSRVLGYSETRIAELRALGAVA
jgi:formyl-CoA transferase